MATARTTQAHQKRVQKIAEEAADKIAADAPFDEEVVVVVEELPPGESFPTKRAGATQVRRDATDATLDVLSQSQQFVAAAITSWIGMTTAPFAARRIVEESFRFAEELLASQKEFALRVAEAMVPAKAA